MVKMVAMEGEGSATEYTTNRNERVMDVPIATTQWFVTRIWSCHLLLVPFQLHLHDRSFDCNGVVSLPHSLRWMHCHQFLGKNLHGPVQQIPQQSKVVVIAVVMIVP